jgi:hypothetical protein
MTPSQIIIQEAQQKGVNPAPIIQDMVARINGGHTVMLQENNSLLLVRRLGDKKAELHLSTVDSPITLKSSLSGFLKKLKDSELDVVYGDTKNDQLIRLMKKAGWPVKDSNNHKYTWMAKV